MRRQNVYGAIVLVVLAALYAGASVATGHSAASELPPDWRAAGAEAGLDVWKTVDRLADGAVILDVRDEEDFARYHLPRSIHAPDAVATDVAKHARGRTVILLAASDEQAQKLTAQAQATAPGHEIRYLAGGARSWYLALDLPVPMFSDAPKPYAYDEALANVKRFVATGDPALAEDARNGAYALARMSYEPNLLKSSSKPKTSGSRKKISGGCGG